MVMFTTAKCLLGCTKELEETSLKVHKGIENCYHLTKENTSEILAILVCICYNLEKLIGR